MPFPPNPMTPPALSATAPALPLQRLTLLVVDDSRYACDALRLILSRAGARLRRADSLEVARLHIGCYRPDLAIVDLGLPDGRGEDLIAELSGQGLPVLGLSGEPEGHARALDAGAAGFVEKPVVSVAGLIRQVRHLAIGAGAEFGGEDTAAPEPDPMALCDDLRRAADLVQTRGDPAYALGFVQSLARAARDGPLAAAAAGARTGFDRAVLARMIEDRVATLRRAG